MIYKKKLFSPNYSNISSVNGVFGLFSIIRHPRLRFNFELLFSYGNYCAGEPQMPLYGDNLYYTEGGLTIDFQFSKKHPNWWLSAGLNTFHIIVYYESLNAKFPFRLHALVGQFTLSEFGIQYKFGDLSTFNRLD